MTLDGLVRVGAAVPHVSVANCGANVDSIVELCERMADEGVRIAVFPELSVTAYTCGDLFQQRALLEGAFRGLYDIAARTARLPIVAIVGLPMTHEGKLINAAAVISSGEVRGVVSKSYLPNYSEFYEKRWFRTLCHPNDTIFSVDGVKFGVEICEDLWAPIPPSTRLALGGAELLFNLSASDSLVGKRQSLTNLIKHQSFTCQAAYVYSSAGYGESTTDLVFDGKAIIAENGYLLADSRRWQREAFFEMADVDVAMLRSDRLANGTFADCADRETEGMQFEEIDVTPSAPYNEPERLLHPVDPTPFIPHDEEVARQHWDEIIQLQALGLVKRLDVTHAKSLTIGISGGLDSTLALLVACRAFDMMGKERSGIIAVTMPGYGTSGRTKTNADALMEALGVTMREISIIPAVEQHFRDIDHDPEVRDVTYENSQARVRTLLLMDIANQHGGFVLGTGDLSELALGWCTYNGDQMSMYGVNADVPKTVVRHLVRRFAELMPEIAPTLIDIVATPVSPELLPGVQITEDAVGPYELHDFFLFQMLRLHRGPRVMFRLACSAFEGTYEPEVILKWLRTFISRFFAQQFKRSCMPDGPKVGRVALSPRGDWRMPSDASAATWMAELDQIKY